MLSDLLLCTMSESNTLQASIDCIKARERCFSRRDWLRNHHKEVLRLRCAAYGLPITGKKDALVERLYTRLHPEPPPSPTQNNDGRGTPDLEEENGNLLLPLQQPLAFPTIKELQALMHQDLLAATSNRPVIQNPIHAALSPASLIIPSRNEPLPTAAFNPTSIPPAQPPTEIPGNILQALPSSSKSSLPPVWQNVMKSIQNKEYIDSSSLLPHPVKRTFGKP